METVTKQKNPQRFEQGKKLVEYNCHKKEKLKCLNEQITKQERIEHKPKPDTNTYVYVGSLSAFGLAIGEPKTLNLKEIFSKCSKNFYHVIYTHG